MKTKNSNRLVLNVVFLICLLVVTNACTVDRPSMSYFYIENQSGHWVTVSSSKKVVTIADGAREFVGEQSALGMMVAEDGMRNFFGDTLEMRFDDSTVLNFYSYDISNPHNPYHILRWDIVGNGSERTYRATFTIDESFINVEQ